MDPRTRLPAAAALNALPGWVRWIAQDADGTWWGYEVQPLQHDCGWYENEVGRSRRILRAAVGGDWRATLVRMRD